jgi:hypothetical protein
LIPFFNYVQAAFVLFERGFLDQASTLRITLEFLRVHGFSADAIGRSYLDLVRRGHSRGTAPAALLDALGRLPASERSEQSRELAAVLSNLGEVVVAPRQSLPPLDYAELAVLHRGGRNRRRPGQRFA